MEQKSRLSQKGDRQDAFDRVMNGNFPAEVLESV